MDWNIRAWIRLAAFSGLISVAAGAFGAHGASTPAARELLKTGATYQAIHALAALASLALGSARRSGFAPPLFIGGTVLFSGSLYALALGAPRWVGAVTPAGGLAFMAGWAVMIWTSGRAETSH